MKCIPSTFAAVFTLANDLIVFMYHLEFTLLYEAVLDNTAV